MRLILCLCLFSTLFSLGPTSFANESATTTPEAVFTEGLQNLRRIRLEIIERLDRETTRVLPEDCDAALGGPGLEEPDPVNAFMRWKYSSPHPEAISILLERFETWERDCQRLPEETENVAKDFVFWEESEPAIWSALSDLERYLEGHQLLTWLDGQVRVAAATLRELQPLAVLEDAEISVDMKESLSVLSTWFESSFLIVRWQGLDYKVDSQLYYVDEDPAEYKGYEFKRVGSRDSQRTVSLVGGIELEELPEGIGDEASWADRLLPSED